MILRMTKKGIGVVQIIEEAEACGVEMTLEQATDLYEAQQRHEAHARRRRFEQHV